MQAHSRVFQQNKVSTELRCEGPRASSVCLPCVFVCSAPERVLPQHGFEVCVSPPGVMPSAAAQYASMTEYAAEAPLLKKAGLKVGRCKLDPSLKAT